MATGEIPHDRGARQRGGAHHAGAMRRQELIEKRRVEIDPGALRGAHDQAEDHHQNKNLCLCAR